MSSGRYAWCPYALSMPMGNTPSVYLACEIKTGVRLNHHLGRGVNATENDGELNPDSLGVSSGGKVLITIKANQILKHESFGHMAVFICNQVMMTEYKESRGKSLLSFCKECF